MQVSRDDAQKLVDLALKMTFLDETVGISVEYRNNYTDYSTLFDILKLSSLEVPSVDDFINKMKDEFDKCYNSFSHLYFTYFHDHADTDFSKSLSMATSIAELFKKEKEENKGDKKNKSKLHRDDIDIYDAFRYESLRALLDTHRGDCTFDENLSKIGSIMRKYFVNSPYGEYTYSEMNTTMKNVIEEHYALQEENNNARNQ